MLIVAAALVRKMSVRRVGRTLGAIRPSFSQVVRTFLHHPRHFFTILHRFAASASRTQSVRPSWRCLSAAAASRSLVGRRGAVPLRTTLIRCTVSAQLPVQHRTPPLDNALLVPAYSICEFISAFWRFNSKFGAGSSSGSGRVFTLRLIVVARLLRHVGPDPSAVNNR